MEWALEGCDWVFGEEAWIDSFNGLLIRRWMVGIKNVDWDCRPRDWVCMPNQSINHRPRSSTMLC